MSARIKYWALVLLFPRLVLGQVSEVKTSYAKEYSKEIAEYNAKTYLLNEILGKINHIVRFEMDAYAASSSGQLTTLVYKSDSLNKSGLLLGFFNTRWNDAGVIYQAYSYKNLTIPESIKLLDSIDEIFYKNAEYLTANNGTNNIFFYFHDFRILLYNSLLAKRIRVFWNGFDSEWEYNSFIKTKNRLYIFVNRPIQNL